MIKEIKYNRLSLQFTKYLQENIKKHVLGGITIYDNSASFMNSVLFQIDVNSLLTIHYKRIISSCTIDGLTREIVTNTICDLYNLHNHKIHING